MLPSTERFPVTVRCRQGEQIVEEMGKFFYFVFADSLSLCSLFCSDTGFSRPSVSLTRKQKGRRKTKIGVNVHQNWRNGWVSVQKVQDQD